MTSSQDPGIPHEAPIVLSSFGPSYGWKIGDTEVSNRL
jgi:hypothetical protein